MSVAVPRQWERFYLRALLTVKRDCPSAACRSLGLTFDDSEWISLFNEVKDSSSTSSLRQTFATALANSSIIDLQGLRNRFKIAFSNDCLNRMQTLSHRLNPLPSNWSEEQCRFDFGLWQLGDNLRELNLECKDVRLSGPIHKWVTEETNSLITDSLNFNRQTELQQHDESLRRFFAGQQAAYDHIVGAIENNCPTKTFFLKGPAGKIVLCVAPSGIAALLLPNSSTSYSLFCIPIECTENFHCNVKGQSDLAKLLKKATLIIWDEITMQHRHHFEVVDGLLRELTGNKNNWDPSSFRRGFCPNFTC
ncbi:hypothetical protein EPUL_001544, partial [Erysiphe pulchra]